MTGRGQMPQEYIDFKVAQAMGVPFTEIESVPARSYMVALTCMNMEGKVKEDLQFKQSAKSKRTTRTK
jgi:hypothetical protein